MKNILITLALLAGTAWGQQDQTRLVNQDTLVYCVQRTGNPAHAASTIHKGTKVILITDSNECDDTPSGVHVKGTDGAWDGYMKSSDLGLEPTPTVRDYQIPSGYQRATVISAQIVRGGMQCTAVECEESSKYNYVVAVHTQGQP
jgi:hypothetical protein